MEIDIEATSRAGIGHWDYNNRCDMVLNHQIYPAVHRRLLDNPS